MALPTGGQKVWQRLDWYWTNRIRRRDSKYSSSTSFWRYKRSTFGYRWFRWIVARNHRQYWVVQVVRKWQAGIGAIARVDLTMPPSSCVRIKGTSQRSSVVFRIMKSKLKTVSLASRWRITQAENVVVSGVIAGLIGGIARGSIDVWSTIESVVDRDEVKNFVWCFKFCKCLHTLS